MAVDLVFRGYQPADRDACVTLFDANCPAFFAANERADYVKFLSTAAGSYELCLIDQQVVGAYGLEPHASGGLALRWIVLSPHVHGRGLGAQLMSRVLETLRRETDNHSCISRPVTSRLPSSRSSAHRNWRPLQMAGDRPCTASTCYWCRRAGFPFGGSHDRSIDSARQGAAALGAPGYGRRPRSRDVPR